MSDNEPAGNLVLVLVQWYCSSQGTVVELVVLTGDAFAACHHRFYLLFLACDHLSILITDFRY
jgi:hypothetical protein